MNEVLFNFQFDVLMCEVFEVIKINGGNEVINEFLIIWRIVVV